MPAQWLLAPGFTEAAGRKVYPTLTTLSIGRKHPKGYDRRAAEAAGTLECLRHYDTLVHVEVTIGFSTTGRLELQCQHHAAGPIAFMSAMSKLSSLTSGV